MHKEVSTNLPGFITYSSGSEPKLLIHAGTHGDEYEVIDLVKKCLEKYETQLPSFIFVPKVSPSAVSKKIRLNKNSQDMNRIFFTYSEDEEVQENINVFKKGPFDLFVSFHEDPEYTDYYVYDTGYDPNEADAILAHNKYLQNNGYSLLYGLDDPNDPDLGYEFIDGYRKFVHDSTDEDNGMILVWALNKHLIQNCYLPEIPGKMEISKKEFIIDSFFKQVIIPYFDIEHP